jgi:hypothetical protein
MRKLTAILLTAALIATGCASSSRPRVATGPQPGVVDRTAMADYVQRLPAGSKVRVERTDGTSMRGTLMKATADAIVVQKNTRVPEPPVEVKIGELARVSVESGGGMSTGKAIGIGIASGVGAFFVILAIIAASFND